MNHTTHQLPRMGLGECLIGKEEEELVLEVVRSKSPFRYYSGSRTPNNPPPMVAALEKEVSAMIGTRFTHGVTSGTAALEVALAALGVGPGDEVIVPVWSWVSCFTAVVRLGAKPVLAEVDDTLTLDPREIGRLTSPQTKVVMVIHYQGVPADMDAIMASAKSCGLAVLEDCAESFGATYHGKRIGSIGDIGIFSFQNQKVVTAGEGGLVVTDDPRLYERAVRMSDLGLYRPYHQAITPAAEPSFCGSNFRMNEMVAAMALAQVRKLDKMLAHVRRLRALLLEYISAIPGLVMRRIPDMEGDIGFETYLLFGCPERAKAFSEALQEWGVSSIKHTGTYCHYAREYCQNGYAQTPSASPFQGIDPWPAQGYREEDFPATKRIIERMVALPIGALFTQTDIDYIGEAIRHAAEKTLQVCE